MNQFNVLLLRCGQLSYLAHEFDRQMRLFYAQLDQVGGRDVAADDNVESLVILDGLVSKIRRAGKSLAGPTHLCAKQLLVSRSTLNTHVFIKLGDRLRNSEICDGQIQIIEEDIGRALSLHAVFAETAKEMNVSKVFGELILNPSDVG